MEDPVARRRAIQPDLETKGFAGLSALGPHDRRSVQRGVPHISAANWLDALAGLGYMHALDRGTQMFFARSVASGRAAEQIAAKGELLETDRFFRRIGLHRNLLEEVRQDIADTERRLEDLRQLQNYLSRKIAAPNSRGNDAGGDRKLHRAERVVVQPPAAEPPKTQPRADAGGKSSKVSNPLKTVEFGPDGFPKLPDA